MRPRKNQPAGWLVKVALSTIRARIDCVYGTKEHERRSEWPEKGQGKEGCTKNGTVGWRREKNRQVMARWACGGNMP